MVKTVTKKSRPSEAAAKSETITLLGMQTPASHVIEIVHGTEAHEPYSPEARAFPSETQPADIRPAILTMPVDDSMPEANPAHVQISQAEAMQSYEIEQQDDLPGVSHPEDQAKLIAKFRLALKADKETDDSLFAAEVSKCVKQHRLGKVALAVRATFKGQSGAWGRFLANEKADPNRINRAMRIAHYLSEHQCKKLPILAAERLVKNIKAFHTQHKKDPGREEMAALTEEALKEYRSGRRQQAKKAGEAALVDLVDPQLGRCYTLKDQRLYRIKEIKGDSLLAISPGSLPSQYPDGARLQETIAGFCAKVESAATADDFDKRMAEWRRSVEESRQGTPSENGRRVNEKPPAKKAEAEKECSSETTQQPVQTPEVADRPSDAAPPMPTNVRDAMLLYFEDLAEHMRNEWTDDEWDAFAEQITDSHAEAYETFVEAVGGDHRYASMIAIAAYVQEPATST
jgi:hypothetical protein